MTTTTDKTKVVFATLLNSKEKQGDKIMLIQFANQTDMDEASAGTPVIVKRNWQD